MTRDSEQNAQAPDVSLSAQAVGEGSLRPAQDGRPDGRPWRVSAQQADLARACFEAGDSVGQIAKVTGMVHSTARRLLDAEITRSGRQLVTWNSMTAEQVEEARGLRAKGWSYRQLAQRYDVSRTAVTRRLKQPQLRQDLGS